MTVICDVWIGGIGYCLETEQEQVAGSLVNRLRAFSKLGKFAAARRLEGDGTWRVLSWRSIDQIRSLAGLTGREGRAAAVMMELDQMQAARGRL
jgi:hypothetical protein